VFLLDPWWNPAVEAQAIDRAHRIGQTRPVFAFRLIARDTVEEKVLELQATKRRLADAIVRADEASFAISVARISSCCYRDGGSFSTTICRPGMSAKSFPFEVSSRQSR
jgi:hypothetical protein